MLSPYPPACTHNERNRLDGKKPRDSCAAPHIHILLTNALTAGVWSSIFTHHELPVPQLFCCALSS